MLISQSYLIRTNRREIHRMMGKLSYLLAPLVIISTLLLVTHLSVFVFNGTAAWESFATWYRMLPIS